MVLVSYSATRNIFWTTIADIWSLIQPVAMLSDKVLAGVVTGRAGSTLDPTKDYLVAGISLVTAKPFFAVVLLIIKRASAVPLV
jgi:hypothetical protein